MCFNNGHKKSNPLEIFKWVTAIITLQYILLKISIQKPYNPTSGLLQTLRP